MNTNPTLFEIWIFLWKVLLIIGIWFASIMGMLELKDKSEKYFKYFIWHLELSVFVMFSLLYIIYPYNFIIY